MKTLIAFLVGTSIFLGGLALAGYVGGYLLFVGGIVQIVEACKLEEVSSMGIAVGALKLVCGGTVFSLMTWGSGLAAGVGATMITSISWGRKRRSIKEAKFPSNDPFGRFNRK